ncbi:hypothetical protein [Nitrosomonas communis]|uniref:Uncharacterized protein n=1 Tax=Nitrosomonas communis TaxID=44574 RepID=A0A1H2SPQ5_9PROT|nr:hypothetical protein [Nitrosomonas communis]SDW33633.1 hypothetical protein SAMN05421882_10085 [Nitrosomonas communis]
MEKPEKEYGKLTLDQFKQIVSELPEIRSQIEELPELIRSAPKEKINTMLDEGIYWAMVYELPFHEQIALLFCALGRTKKLSEAQRCQILQCNTTFFAFVTMQDFVCCLLKWNGIAG